MYFARSALLDVVWCVLAFVYPSTDNPWIKAPTSRIVWIPQEILLPNTKVAGNTVLE